MRAKIALLIFGVLIGLSVSLFFGAHRQDQKVPEKVVYYTTSSPTGDAGDETEEGENPVTEEQAEKLKKLGFSTKLVPITTTFKNRRGKE